MLTYKINARNIKRDDKPIDVESSGGVPFVWKSDVITVNSPNHGLEVGDTVRFARSDGRDIQFLYQTEVNSVVTADRFTIPTFRNRVLQVNAAGVEKEKYHYSMSEKSFLLLSLMDEEHDFIENRLVGKYSGKTSYINEYIYDDYSNPTYGIRRCDGDYVLYNDIFLYTANVDGNTGKYTFNASADVKNLYRHVKNTKADVFIVFDEETDKEIREAYGDGQIGGDTWAYDNGVMLLSNCLIPVKKDGKDDRHLIMWGAETLFIAKLIARKCRNLTFYAIDERFIDSTNETSDLGIKCVFKRGTVLYKTSYVAKFSEPILQDFGANLFQEESLRTDFVNQLINSAKNKTIDYEKKCFSPVYVSGNTTCDLEELRFNLHFRERPVEVKEENEYKYYTYNDWKTTDDYYWNNYTNGGSGLVATHVNDPNAADLIGYLGFTDQDVIKLRNRISRSFLRLSFYDTRDRRTQKLLFTSTIFMNVGKLYEQYSTNVRMGSLKTGAAADGVEAEYVFTEDDAERICATFSCRDKYTSSESSEGFYLYLFPGLLDENGKGEIYMKAEFNHAKYGYTIPFTLPTKENDVPIDPTEGRFPIDYTNGGYVDMNRLFNDMYVKVLIEFDENTKKYTWRIPGVRVQDGVINLNLFEPRLNSGEGAQVMWETPISTISYKGQDGLVARVVVAEGESWRITSVSNGMTVTPQSGTGSQQLRVNIAPNNGEDSGSTRYLSAEFNLGSRTASLGATQEAANYPFSVTPSTITSDYNGMTAYIHIEDSENLGWDITRRTLVDIFSPTSGIGNADIEILFGANRSLSTLNGELIVKDRTFNIENRVALIQYGVNSNWSGAPVNIDNFSNEGGTFDVEIYDPDGLGSEFIPNPALPWITLDGTADIPSEHKRIFTFSVAPNTGNVGERYGDVLIRDEEFGLYTHLTTLAQKGTVGKVTLNINAGSFYMDYPSSERYQLATEVKIGNWTISAGFDDNCFTNQTVSWGQPYLPTVEVEDTSLYGTQQRIDWILDAQFVDDPSITYQDSGYIYVNLPLSTQDSMVTVNLPNLQI